MCYMSEGEGRARVGVRELRQNLSVYLDRVKEGESLDVTERGQVVARLAPSHGDASTYEQMIEDGRIIAGKANLSALGAPRPSRGRPLSKIIGELRDEETY
jgi:prevent-host-death family protein